MDKIDEINKKIDDLGIINLPYIKATDDQSHIDTIDAAVSAVEAHNIKYPMEYEAVLMKFIKKVRKRVWKYDQDFQSFYFDKSAKYFWKQKDAGFKPKECYDATVDQYATVANVYKVYKDYIL